MKIKTFFFNLLIIILIGCSSDDNSKSYNANTIFHDGINREYLVYIPESYDGSEEYPVLFSFHGGSGYANDFTKR